MRSIKNENELYSWSYIYKLITPTSTINRTIEFIKKKWIIKYNFMNVKHWNENILLNEIFGHTLYYGVVRIYSFLFFYRVYDCWNDDWH